MPRYMIRPPIYTSYAVSPATTTPDGCFKQGVVFIYPPSGSPRALSNISCPDAKAKFKSGGGKVPQTGGEPCPGGIKTASGNCQPSTLQSQTAAGIAQQDNKLKQGADAVNATGKAILDVSKKTNDTLHNAIFGTPDAPSKSPAGCDNCPDAGHWWSFIDPRQWGCKIGKLSCEMHHVADNGFSGIMQFIKDNALFIIGGGLIAIVLLTKVFRMI